MNVPRATSAILAGSLLIFLASAWGPYFSLKKTRPLEAENIVLWVQLAPILVLLL